MIKNDWTLEELIEIHNQPLLDLLYQAQCIHHKYHKPSCIQKCQLISVKTGGCPENCKYCAQSSYYQTEVTPSFMPLNEVLEIAKKAYQRGVSRICLGAAWREVRDNNYFTQIVAMVREIASWGMEVCCTLGMLNESQAKILKEAGLFAYNHNLDSSEKFYQTIISTRSYEDRLKTHEVVGKCGLSLCSGIILGMGETVNDRLEFLLVLNKRNPHPESIPINRLVAIPGTPLEKQAPITIFELLRMIAITRIIFPKAMIRLSAGREKMTTIEHILAFLAGANSLHVGEKLLTIKNASLEDDEFLFKILDLKFL